MINSLGTQRIIGKYAVKCQPCEIKCNSRFWTCIRDVRGGAFSSGAGRGEDKNSRGVYQLQLGSRCKQIDCAEAVKHVSVFGKLSLTEVNISP